MIRSEAEWLQRIQEAQKEYERERRMIDSQRGEVRRDVEKLSNYREELLNLQDQAAMELGRVLAAKAEVKSGAQRIPVAESTPTSPSNAERRHSRVPSTSSTGMSGEDESSTDDDVPMPSLNEVADTAEAIIPTAVLLRSFPYRALEKISKKICPKTIITNAFEIRNADDLRMAQKQFSKLRCIKRIHLQSSPDAHRPPLALVEAALPNAESISAMIFKKRLLDLKTTLQKERSSVPPPQNDYKTHASIGFFFTEALSDDETHSAVALSNVLCAFRFRLECQQKLAPGQPISKHLNELEALLSRWTKFAEVQLNAQMRRMSESAAPQFTCSLGRLPRNPQQEDAVGYEILWRFNDAELPTPTAMKSDAVVRDEQFRFLLNNLTQMMLGAVTSILDQHAGKFEEKINAAEEELQSFGVDRELADKARGVFHEVLELHKKIQRLHSTAASTSSSPEVTLLHRRLYLLLSCLASTKAFVDISGTVAWDTDVIQSPRFGTAGASQHSAFDVGDLLKMMSPSDGKKSSDAALAKWKTSGAKMFENVTEFLTPVFRYFQIDDPKHPKDGIYRSAHIQMNMVNVPHAVLHSLHKMAEYRKDAIVLSRLVRDPNTGEERYVKGRVNTKSSMLSTGSKVSLGLTFYDELHFDIRRPRPADQQNGVDNESLIEEKVSNTLEEVEAQTQESLNDLKQKLSEEEEAQSEKFAKAKALFDEAAATASEVIGDAKQDLSEFTGLSEELEKWNRKEPRMACTAMRVVLPFLAPKSQNGMYQPPPRYINLRWSLDDVSK